MSERWGKEEWLEGAWETVEGGYGMVEWWLGMVGGWLGHGWAWLGVVGYWSKRVVWGRWEVIGEVVGEWLEGGWGGGEVVGECLGCGWGVVVACAIDEICGS